MRTLDRFITAMMVEQAIVPWHVLSKFDHEAERALGPNTVLRIRLIDHDEYPILRLRYEPKASVEDLARRERRDALGRTRAYADADDHPASAVS